MSAIAGIFDLAFSDEVIEKLRKTMKRRGPGTCATYSCQNKTLIYSGCTPAGEHNQQPFVLDWAGERYVIVFDGFLTNSSEITPKLIQEGHFFDTGCDAEVVLRGYISWGTTVLNKLNGVFAMVIIHEHQDKVFLARDRLGVRPLFYSSHASGFLCASEIKTILAYPSVRAQLDAEGITELMLIGPGRKPGSAVFRGINEMEPGWYGIYENGNLKLRQYWKLTDHINQESFSDAKEIVRTLVMQSVREQIPAESEIGAMLSGGLDSSIISSICAREMDARGRRLHTFSLDFCNNDLYFKPERFQPNMDTEFIRLMQDALDSEHHWTILTPQDLIEEIENATIARDLPGMADVDTSLMSFCRYIRPHVKTVFSGECADEIFCGYPWYRDPELRERSGFPWSMSVQERSNCLHRWVRDKISPEEFVFSHYLDTINQADILPENDACDRRIKELVNLNLRWFMQTLLERGDRMGSFCGVEIRVPFCDYRIAEYLYGVPWSFKDYKGMEKGLLRSSMEGMIPDSVLYRKKNPFPKTYDPEYLQIVSNMLADVLKNKSAPIHQLVQKEALEDLLHREYAWPWYGQLMRRPQTIVYMLQINYWLELYSVTIV